MKDIIAISEGNEIAYAKNFTDLLKTQIDDNIITSTKGKCVKAELYSRQVFLNSNSSKESFKLIIGNAAVKTPDMELVYNNNGMKCYVGNQFAKLIVDSEQVLTNYDSIFSDLERIEKEYFEKEADYVTQCGRKKSAYVEKTKSLFSKRWITERITQAYCFLAYQFYFDFL